MRKVSLVLACFMAPLLLLAQQSAPGTKITTSGFVLQKAYQVQSPAIRATIVDARGGFVFNLIDLNGKPSGAIFKYDKSNQQWTDMHGNSGIVLVAGISDMDQMQPGNEVDAIYWKDADNNYWCVSSDNAINRAIQPKQLDEAMAENKAIQLKDASGEVVVGVALPIQVRHQ